MGMLHIVMGDFNGPFEIPKMKQLVKLPTRGKNVLDLVFFCNLKDAYIDIGHSNHKMMKISSKYHPVNKRKTTTKYRTVVKTDCAELDRLMEKQFEQFIDGNDTEKANGNFYFKIREILKQCSEEI